MSTHGTIRRYTLIIEKIGSGQYPSFKEIKEFLFGQGFEVSDRTLQRDIEQIRYEFGIEFAYDRSKNGYYVDESLSVDMDSFLRFLEIVNTAEVLSESLSDSKEALNYISFDTGGGLKGLEYLPKVLRAIKDQRIMRVVHHTYYSEKARTFKLEPYLLKEYQNRWYIIANVRGMNEMRTFAVDRIEALEILTDTFKRDPNIDVRENFRHVVGLVYSINQLEDVELSFTAFQGNYIKSLPLHHSQHILIDDENELRVSYKIIPNFEFTQKILMHGENVKVIKPDWLRDEIKVLLQNALNQYN